MSTTITGTFSNSDKGKDIEKCHIHQAADHIPEEVTAAILLTAAAVPGTAAAEAVLLPAADAHHPHRFRDARDTFITSSFDRYLRYRIFALYNSQRYFHGKGFFVPEEDRIFEV